MRTKMLLNEKCAIIYVILMFYSANFAECHPCSRVPEGFGKRSPSTGLFRIRLSESSGQYKPGKQYTIWLERSDANIRSGQKYRPAFVGFFLTVEQAKTNETSIWTEEFNENVHGTFNTVVGDTLTKNECGNLVTHTTDVPKSEIQVWWTAPLKGSGCVVFRATVIEHRDFWYMDDGPLSKEFCVDDQDEEKDFYSSTLERCCACNEAKYELTFEGLWSRNTHPNDFPNNAYTTKFSDIIGASHEQAYWFWRNKEIASEGLKDVTLIGSTKLLESELKNQRESIRTIIKARGLSYPNITGKTFAVFRVDTEHHLVSLISVIFPSPDWFVGVSGLELCQPDCTWTDHKSVDLYPWDAGTSSGVSYNSPYQETKPQEYIRRITSDSPISTFSPFYDPNGFKMKPLARLTLTKLRVYGKPCSDQNQNRENTFRVQTSEIENETEECTTNCDETNNSQETVVITNDPECPLSKWSEWSECSQRCGKGIQTRTRSFDGNRDKCKNRYQNNNALEQTKTCENPCVDDIPMTKYPDVDCEMNLECDVTCGFGQYKVGPDAKQCADQTFGNEQRTCGEDRCHIPEFCYDNPKIDQSTCGTDNKEAVNKYYFNKRELTCYAFTTNCDPVENEFEFFEECMTKCTGFSTYGRNEANIDYKANYPRRPRPPR